MFDLDPTSGAVVRSGANLLVAAWLDFGESRYAARVWFGLPGTDLSGATYGPNFSAHIDQMKTIPRQLAECFGIA
jgi:hypothetical protein